MNIFHQFNLLLYKKGVFCILTKYRADSTYGRIKIFIDTDDITPNNVLDILSNVMISHSANALRIEYLYNYYKGKQDILSRTKETRPEICNKITENRANEIVSFKTGYLVGEPIQYVSAGSSNNISEPIKELNDYMVLCHKPKLDVELAEWMYICGTGYRLVLPNKALIKESVVKRLLKGARKIDLADESPFNLYVTDPRNSFVVYLSDISEKPVMGVRYVVKADGSVHYSVWTEKYYFEISDKSGSKNVVSCDVNEIGYIPLVEYPLNNARLGSFEIVLPILNAINETQSNRCDGIEQFIQSLMIIYNAEIDTEQAKAIRDAGIIKLNSVGDNRADIKILSEELNQQQTQTLVDYMYQTVLNIVGMPNRNGGSSTSDTGAASVIRDGWETANARAEMDEMYFKASEMSMLKIVLHILRSTVNTELLLKDLDAHFTRRNYENIQSKAQVLTMMLGNTKIHPLLAFEHCGMFSDAQGAYEMSMQYNEEQQAKFTIVNENEEDVQDDLQGVGQEHTETKESLDSNV